MIYTVHSEYGATGEGNSFMVLVTYAQNKEDAIAKFAEEFSSYMAIGAKVIEGVSADFYYSKYLISEVVLNALLECEGRAMVNYKAQYYENWS